MARLVSRKDCFIIREKADFGKVPLDVRHLSIHSCQDIDHASLLSLCKHTKLRTLLFGTKDISAVIDQLCSGLHRLRVMCCGSTNELPDSIGNLKHLRYLEITGGCSLNSVPLAFCYLYSLQIVYARNCRLETMRGDLSNLISLRRFKSHGFDYSPGCVLEIDLAYWQGLGLGFIKNVSSDVKGLRLCNLGNISKNQAAELELKNKQRLNSLELNWGWYPGEEDNDRDREVLQALQPPTSLMSLHLERYEGVFLPISWFGPQNLQSSTSLTVDTRCDGLESKLLAEGTSFSRVSQRIDDLNEMLVDSNQDTTCIFPSMTELTISECGKLSSLEHLIQPAYIPAINKITIENCKSLTSIGHNLLGSSTRGPPFSSLTSLIVCSCEELSTIDNLLSQEYLPVIHKIKVEWCYKLMSLPVGIGSLSSLRQLEISGCPSIRWPSGLVFPSSLESLNLDECGDMSACVPSCLENLTSLVSLSLKKCVGIQVIPEKVWSKSLQQLWITDCPDLVSIGGARAIAQLRVVIIKECPKMEDKIKQPHTRGCFIN
ncbi:hypothetical protein VPH35_064118 [Triticum aestivum]|uniref:disease resistance protein RGA2 n=1 Tax=Triticum aestivum TaxID=4565 RepID=UPI001D00F110|nr:disease resistance protein RGA2-like [Triticum aestivum]